MKKLITIICLAGGLIITSVSNAQTGAALNFNGINNYGVITYAQPTTNITNEFWFKTSTANGGMFSITDAIPNPPDYDRDIYLSGGNVKVYVYGPSSTETISSSGTNYADGNWHHLAWVMGTSVGGQKLYLDGVLKASGVLTSSGFNWNTKVLLGYSAMAGPNNYFNGSMDELRLWTRALTQCEIQNHMSCELPAGATALAALYHFNQGTAGGANAGINTLTDASGNGLTATLTNFALTGATSNWVSPGGVVTGTACNLPTITSFTPTSAATGGTITITGTDLGGTTAVSIGGTAATSFTVVSATSVTAVVAGGTSGSVTITSCDGITSLAGFTFQTGAGLNFNGSNNYLNIGTPITSATGYTKEAWIYATASGSCNIISSTSSPFWLSGGKISAAHHWGSGGTVTIQDPATFTLNTWTHIAVTYDLASTTLNLYKNGVLVATSAAAPSYPIEAIQIGIYGGGNNFAGTMDEVRIWSYARTQCQIQTNMNCELSGSPAGLVTYYQFNQGLAGGTNTGLTSAIDASGNGNTGTLVNFTLTGASSNWVSPGAVTSGVSCSAAGLPTITATTPASRCGTGTVSLGATASAGVVNWYAASSGGVALGSGTTFTTPSISATTTYYAEANNGGCLSAARSAVVATINPVPAASIGSQTNVSCNSGSNGSVTVSVSSGTPAYTYSWLPSAGTAATASGLTQGSYICTITDSKGCSTTQTATITQPSAITSAVASQTNVSCNGASTGSATVSALGGTPSFTYAWSPSGGTAATASGLAAGTYVCTITDANACTKTQNVTITQPAAISSLVSSQTNVSCNGGSNGSATVSALGGTPSFTYAWSPSGGTAATASGLVTGAYVCTITDANSCTKTQTATISQPSAITSSVASTNVSCFGGSNGTATVTAGSGTPGYTYAWSPSGGTAATASGLVAGAYVCTITDANACTKTQSVTITQPSAITSSVSSQTNVSCNGGSNGTATVTAGSGTPGYTYAWSPSGGTAATATGLAVGTYVCTITDANACTKTQSVTITQPSAITSSVSSQTNVSCNGGSNGSATVSALGGTPSFTYAWSPSGGTAATASGLAAGTYVCTITDANGCTKTQSVTITQPTAITSSVVSTNASCFGGSNGSATVTAGNGTPGYTYTWTGGGGTAATASGLVLGTYTCTITDANSCTKTQVATITQPTAITSSVASTNVSCNGGSNGSATVTAGSGTPGYTYAWSPSGGTAATASGLVAGAYVCTITDANACTKTQSVTITQPSAITSSVSSQTNVSCNGGSNGSATVTAGNGTPGYTYTWTGGGGTAAIASGLVLGTYTCTITDANSCTKTQVATITQPTAITSSVASTNVSCFGGSNGSATVTAGSGTPGYTYAWSPSGGTAAIASGLVAGAYVCTITDANACTKTQNVTITQPAAISSLVSSQTNVSCNGGSNGSATVSALGGTPSFTYAWSPSGGTAATASGLAAGTYVCTITDANSCTKTQAVIINEPTALSANISASANVTCNGSTNGSATVNVSGGTTNYTYSWSSGGTAATENNLSGGTYTCNILDANACSTSAIVTIAEPTAISSSVSAQTDNNCYGASMGSATINASGGTGTLTYAWSPSGGTAATASALAAGTYTCNMTDANACTASAIVTIAQPAMPFVATILYQQSNTCNGGFIGYIEVTETGGSPTYNYSWSNGLIGSGIYAQPAGIYTCTITDSYGCTASVVGSIIEPAAIVTALSSQTDINCNGASTGSATVNASGGTGALTYAWAPAGGTNATASGLTAGVYTCTVTDANACNTSITVTLVEPSAISYTSSVVPATCGQSNGSASVMASGGTGTFTYSWSPVNGNIFDISNVPSGPYSCTIQDANACSSIASISVPNSNGPAVTVTSTSDVLCFGNNTGTATISASGGNGTYTYSWLPAGGNGAAASGLTAGTYTCQVTDANGCIGTTSAIILQPNSALEVTSQQTDVTCQGLGNGTATAVVSGGTAAYTYSWTSGNTTANITSLSPGTTTCTVTDANGCNANVMVTIAEPGLLSAAISAQTNVSCNGLSDGSATVTVSGGSASYTYSWPSGDSAPVEGGLSAGNATCIILDANGCSTNATVTISQPAPVVISVTSTSSGACNGGADTLNASGVVSYTWSPSAGLNTSAGTQVIATVSAGITYTVTGNDISGCPGSNTITLNLNPDPTTPVITASGNVLTASGSASSYQWYFEGNPIAGASSQTYTALSAGNYTVMETNSFGCSAISASYSFTITGLNNLAGAEILKLYPNPSLNDVTLEMSNTGDHTELYLYDMLEQQVKTFRITGTTTTLHHDEIGEGVYIYRIIRDQVIIGTGRLIMQR